MALPVTIPNTFANATSSIPLSQLDTNFSTLANAVNGLNSGSETLANLKATTANVGVLTVTGNATIGDASTDTVTLNSTLTANTAVIFAAGTSAAPSITTTGDLNTGIFFPAADTIAFAEGGAEAMRIDSDGDVGIGTSSPAFKLDISGGGTTAKINTLDTHDGGASLSTWMKVGRRAGTGTNAYINTLHSGSDAVSALTWAFGTSGTGTEVMRIDSSGNVGIGTSSPATKLNVAGTFTITGAGQQMDNGQGITAKNTSGTYRQLMVMDGSNNLGLGGTVDGGILFYTSAGNERARITSDGDFLVGTTTAYARSAFKARTGVAAGWFGVATNGDAAIFFANASDSTQGNITVNSNSVTYNSTSDYRLKENIIPMTGALSKVALLKPCIFNWKSDGSFGQGFIAHELQEIVPDAVTGEKDDIDEEGNPKYQSIDTSVLVATLTAAIQEQQAMIDELKAEVAALKAK